MPQLRGPDNGGLAQPPPLQRMPIELCCGPAEPRDEQERCPFQQKHLQVLSSIRILVGHHLWLRKHIFCPPKSARSEGRHGRPSTHSTLHQKRLLLKQSYLPDWSNMQTGTIRSVTLSSRLFADHNLHCEDLLGSRTSLSTLRVGRLQSIRVRVGERGWDTKGRG